MEAIVYSITNQIIQNPTTINHNRNLVDGKNKTSISIWVKIKNFTNSNPIISKSNAPAPRTNEFVLKASSDRTIQFELDSNSGIYIVKTPQLNTNTWYHIVGTYDGSEMKIYTNGAFSDSKPKTGRLLNLSNLDLNIGANSLKTEFFNGAIDELNIYDRVLNASEIQTIYNGNCNLMRSDQPFTLEQDNINPSLGNSYICFNRNVYSCKEYPDEFTTIIASNLQQVGSWQCDIDTEKWINIIPRFQRASTSCNYSSNCGPFTITSNTIGNITYELQWDFYLKNGSISYISDSISSSNSIAQISKVISTPSKELVDKVILKVATLKDNHKSKYTEQTIPITYTCTNECNYIGQIQCNTTVLSKRKVCGAYNTSNSCLTWGPLGDCENNKICKNNQCIDGTKIDTCTNANGICLNSQLPNTVQTNEDCSEPDYFCYKCSSPNQSRIYTWDPLFLSCIRTNCTNTCTINKGICKNSSIENSASNSSLDCCNNEECYICNSNYHPYNDTCVSNSCLGNLPSTAGQNSTLIGPNNFTIGSAQNWTFKRYATTLNPCEWKCTSGYRKITNETFNGCVEGLPPCETNIGCTNETIANAAAIEGNCTTGFQCYQCNAGYNWTNNTCVSTCPNNGCIYNDMCLTQGIRMINSSNKKVYCFNTTMQEQKPEETPCSQNYECISNYCRNGNCTSLLSEISKTRTSTERLTCWIRKLFGSSEICN